MSKIIDKLRIQEIKKTAERFKEGKIELMTYYDLRRTPRIIIDKPLFFEKELIKEYDNNFLVSRCRGKGYTTCLAKLALQNDCCIIVVNNLSKIVLHQKVLELSYLNVKPTCWQKFLIKLGF